MLRYQPFIQRSLAALLLLLFSVCIAPRNFVHDALARHQDRTACDHPVQEEVCLHPAEKHCHFNDPMQVSACILPATAIYLPPPAAEAEYSEALMGQELPAPLSQHHVRGPPCLL